MLYHLRRLRLPFVLLFVAFSIMSAAAAPQESARMPADRLSAAPGARPPAAASADYVIGPDDVLSISFWREKDLTTEVSVRPDGKVTLPLLNDIVAAGLTPEQLRDSIRTAAKAYLEDPTPTVVVKEVKSRRVFITGQVEKPGPYPLNDQLNVLQLIAVAGGLKEFADGKHITVMRPQNGAIITLPFNYQDVVHRRHLEQNIALRPGDTVVVP